MDLGFIILCPDKSVVGLRNTLISINYNSYNREILAVVGDDASAAELKSMKEICPVYKGKNTITSLINVGIRKCDHDWVFIMFSGSRIKPYLEKKIDQFIKTDKDILFPVSENEYDFMSSPLNGVIINKKFFQEIGDFSDIAIEKEGTNDFELAKLFWCLEAMKHKAVFKGIAGMKIK